MNKLILNPRFGLYEKGGKPYCSSRQLAETFEKEHKNVLRDIRIAQENMLSADNFTAHFWAVNFIETQYKERGKFYPEFHLTKDGFTYVAMGFTGEKAAVFKIAYIDRFNRNERFIQDLKTAKMEFPAFTDAVMMAHEEPKHYHFSNEIDMINRIVLGVSAKKFKEMYGIPGDTESIRPYLSDKQIEGIVNLQRTDIGLLVSTPDFHERKQLLTGYYGRINQRMIGTGHD